MATTKEPKVTLLLGEPRNGKSTKLRALLEAERGRCILWDHNREHAWFRADAEGDALAVLKRQASSSSRLERIRCWGGVDSFKLLCAWILRVQDAGAPPLAFAVDEGHLVTPDTAARSHAWRDLVLRHRHLKLRLYCVGWRPVELPRYLVAADPTFFCFKTTRALDRKWLERNLSPQVAARVPNLRRGEAATYP